MLLERNSFVYVGVCAMCRFVVVIVDFFYIAFRLAISLFYLLCALDFSNYLEIICVASFHRGAPFKLPRCLKIVFQNN